MMRNERKHHSFCLFLVTCLFHVILVASQTTTNETTRNNMNVCLAPPRANNASSFSSKTEYRVGVLAIRGFASAYREFNKTFSDYLTASAGRQLGPITFRLVPLNFIKLFDDVEEAFRTNGQRGVDFIYVNPSAFSCIESEYGANTLASQISLRKVGGKTFRLTKFGGVIFTRADNDEVQTIHDLRDKIIACASISGLGSGQMQFRLMQQNQLSYLQDPKQLVFTSNQGKVVNGVLNGQFDVGFVRTDQIERTKGPDGNLVDMNLIKIINGGFETLEGSPFPFESSTILYPEWNIASLSHVPDIIAQEVQTAMLDISLHADIGRALRECLTERNCTATIGFDDNDCATTCYNILMSSSSLPLVCKSNPHLATLALQAMEDGRYAGWRSTLSYMELRNMQEETNFIRRDANGTNACIRSSRIFDAVVCPPGHFRRPEEDVIHGCANAGLDCGDFQCLCKPCISAFDVDVFPIPAARDDFEETKITSSSCPKFSICGQVQQSRNLTFRMVDNKKRDDPIVTVRLFEGENEHSYQVSRVAEFIYEFTFDARDSTTGIVIFEVHVQNEQIPESPFRIQVMPRECAIETGDDARIVDAFGNCICDHGSVDIGGSCVQFSLLIPSVVIPVFVVLALIVYALIDQKRRQGDSIWSVNPKELIFEEPPTILGRGTFGLVLLAEYRGTQVAVKRVIPPKVAKCANHPSQENFNGWRNTLLGDGYLGDHFPGFACDSSEPPKDQTEDLSELGENNNNDDDNVEAMESGALMAYHGGSRRNVIDMSQSNNSNRRLSLRRSSIGTLNSARQESKRRNSYFDFNNLKEGALEGTHGSVTSASRGQESAQNLIATLQKEYGNSSCASKKSRRRYSMGTSFTSDDNAIDEEPTASLKDPLSMQQQKQQPKPIHILTRRGSLCSVSSDMSDSILGSHRQLSVHNDVRTTDQIPPVDPTEECSLFPSPASSHSKKNSSLNVSQDIIAPLEHRLGSFHDILGSEHNGGLSVSRISSEQQARKDKFKSSRSLSGSSWGSLDSAEFRELMAEDEKQFFKSSDTFSLNASFDVGGGSNNKRWRIRRKGIFGAATHDYARLKADFMSEMRHLSKLRHPCITTVMGAVISHYMEPMLVMEYMDHGALYDLLHNSSMIIDGEVVLPILRDVAQGMRFLHAANPQVIHGDLKAQNVLVDSKFRAKVSDFGLSQKKRVGAVGTPLWMAPELLRGESDNSSMSDVYSFGIMLYEVYSRKDPYHGESPLIQVLRNVADPTINKRPPVPKSCPPKVASIMMDSLLSEPLRRPTFEELDLRLKRLDVANVEPGKMNFSMQQSKKQQERAARNEELLFQVFPRHIAEALRDGRKVQAESFDCVSIFFSDIVGYTTISSKLHPKKVSAMLDRLYSKFDDLSTRHNVFKIETIGDAYMAVTNLHCNQQDHAARIAAFAIRAVSAASSVLIDEDDPGKGYVKIRVGIHSGPIVADVVGSRSPKYTLFGDTVNTASRMESYSSPLRIQCSDRTAQLLRGSGIPVISRGKIQIKGKGEMHTYWVNEDATPEKAPSCPSPSSSSSSIVHNETTTITVENNKVLDAISEAP